MRWLVLLSILTACGGGYQERRGISGKTWWELRSPHFVVRTDVDRAVAERRLVELEDKYRALGETFDQMLGGFAPPDEVTQVILFGNCNEVNDLSPNHLGFVTLSRDFGSSRMLVTCEGFRYASQVFLHELTHVFNSYSLGPIPIWLQEGLAGYLMTIEIENGQIVIGRPFIDTQNLHGHPLAGMPTLDRLLTADSQRFHFGNEEFVYYMASKNLVGALASAEQGPFFKYLRMLARGTGRDAAWQESMSGVSMEDLGEAMRLYHTQSGAKVFRVPYRPGQAVPSPVVQRMRPGEVHALWVHAQLLRGRLGDVRPLLEQIDAADREDPEWSDADFWKAVVLSREDKPDLPKILALLRNHVAQVPGDERARIGLVSVALRQALPENEGSVGAETHAAAAIAALQPDVLALGKIARSAAALNEVAWYFALTHSPDVGLNFARRALDADPACYSCKDTLGLLFAELGRYDEAVQAQEEAVGAIGDNAVPAGMRDRLSRFRALRDRCVAQPTSPPCSRKK